MPIILASITRAYARWLTPEREEVRSGGGGDEAETELVQGADRALERRVEDAGDGAEVVAAHGEHAAVEVLALHLDHLQVAHEHLGHVRLQLAQPGEVDGDARLHVG